MAETRCPTGSNKAFDAIPLELHGHRKKVKFFLNQLEKFVATRGLKPENVEVLEVGCSNGRNVAMPLAEKGYSVTGIDLHEESIEYAVSRNAFPNATFLCQDFYVFDSEEIFDVIVLSDVLEHVHEPLQFLEVAVRHLSSNGIMLVCVPNGRGPYELEQWCLRKLRLDKAREKVFRLLRPILDRGRNQRVAYNSESGHVQFFRQKDIESMAERSGLQIDVQENGALFGGGITAILGRIFPFIVTPSLWVADWLPSPMVSTWYFRMSPASDTKAIDGGQVNTEGYVL